MVLELSPLSQKTGVDFKSRVVPANLLKEELQEITQPLVDRKLLPYNTSKHEVTVKLPRDVFQDAGVDYRIYDALWGRKYENNIVPQDDRERDITFAVSKFGLLIGDRMNNSAFLLDLNSQGILFDLSVRTLDTSRDYGALWLVDDAKRYIGQSTGRFVSRLTGLFDIDRESFAKVYDFNAEDNIRKDFMDGASLLKAVQTAFSNTSSLRR